VRKKAEGIKYIRQLFKLFPIEIRDWCGQRKQDEKKEKN
jgi:hypothetical protein